MCDISRYVLAGAMRTHTRGASPTIALDGQAIYTMAVANDHTRADRLYDGIAQCGAVTKSIAHAPISSVSAMACSRVVLCGHVRLTDSASGRSVFGAFCARIHAHNRRSQPRLLVGAILRAYMAGLVRRCACSSG